MCIDVGIQEYALGYKTDFSNAKYEKLIIFGYADSTAETYANEKGFAFIDLDEPISTVTQTTQTTSPFTTATTTTISSDNSEATTNTQKVNPASNGNANKSKEVHQLLLKQEIHFQLSVY